MGGCYATKRGKTPRESEAGTSKLTEIRKALVSAGCDTVAKQAAVLGLRRSTTWALFNQDKSAGPSAIVLKLEEYVEAKIAGLYGHSKPRTQAFRDAFQDRQSGKHTTSFQRRILEPPRERAVESLDLQ
jgi:hypothetical protein